VMLNLNMGEHFKLLAKLVGTVLLCVIVIELAILLSFFDKVNAGQKDSHNVDMRATPYKAGLSQSMVEEIGLACPSPWWRR